MATQGDRESETGRIFPPGITTKADQYLYEKIEEVGSDVNEIAKAVNAVPASIDEKIKPLNGELARLVDAIESFARLPEDVGKIREEFTGFRGFRERIEGHEKGIKDLISKYAFRAVAGAIAAAFALGGFLTWIKWDVSQMKDSTAKLGEITYQLNGIAKSQDERLKNVDDQLKSVQVSMRETAKIAAEASDKASERIAGVLEAFERRTSKDNSRLVGKIDTLERKFEEASSVLVMSFTLTSEHKPDNRTQTHLIYEMQVPPQQRRSIGSRAIRLAGAVSFFDGGGVPFEPSGIMGATASPKGEETVVIILFFRDNSAVEAFLKRLEERKPIGLKVTFAL